jgi:hypothetical protein
MTSQGLLTNTLNYQWYVRIHINCQFESFFKGRYKKDWLVSVTTLEPYWPT